MWFCASKSDALIAEILFNIFFIFDTADHFWNWFWLNVSHLIRKLIHSPSLASTIVFKDPVEDEILLGLASVLSEKIKITQSKEKWEPFIHWLSSVKIFTRTNCTNDIFILLPKRIATWWKRYCSWSNCWVMGN